MIIYQFLSTKEKINMEWSYEMMWGKVEILPTLARKGPIEKVTYEARSKGGERIDRVGGENCKCKCPEEETNLGWTKVRKEARGLRWQDLACNKRTQGPRTSWPDHGGP